MADFNWDAVLASNPYILGSPARKSQQMTDAFRAAVNNGPLPTATDPLMARTETAASPPLGWNGFTPSPAARRTVPETAIRRNTPAAPTRPAQPNRGGQVDIPPGQPGGPKIPDLPPPPPVYTMPSTPGSTAAVGRDGQPIGNSGPIISQPTGGIGSPVTAPVPATPATPNSGPIVQQPSAPPAQRGVPSTNTGTGPNDRPITGGKYGAASASLLAKRRGG